MADDQPKYWPVTVSTENIYCCRVCGSITSDPELHDRWHTQQKEARNA